MAFLTSREHDVFISYAHVDNEPEDEGEPGWVESFEKRLRIKLLKTNGTAIELWRDPELSRAQLFDKVIEKAVRGSGLMISLISPSSLESDYCELERKWFTEMANSDGVGFEVNQYIRIFPVLLYNLPHEAWPAEVQGASAHMFHDGKGTRGQPLDPASDDFEDRLYTLTEEVLEVLGSLREQEKRLEPPEASPAVVEENAFSIFLATPPEDLRPAHRRLAGDLGKRGIELVGEDPLPYDENEHAQAVTQAIQRADLTVHLLSTSAGEQIEEGAERTYPVEQVRIGLEHAKSQLILLPDAFDPGGIEVPSYADFMRTLQERKREADQLELVKTGRHQMLDQILAKRRHLDEAAKQRMSESAEGLGSPFIDLHPKDIPYAADLVGYLSEKQIAPVMIPSADLQPKAAFSLFEDNLRKARLLIMVFGGVAREWIEHRLEVAFQLILKKKLQTKIGIYIAPPHKAPDQVAFPPFCEVATNMEAFDPASVDSLLANAAGTRT